MIKSQIRMMMMKKRHKRPSKVIGCLFLALVTVEWGELGRWCELGQNFSESSPLLLLVKGHWCAMGQKFSAL